MRFAQPVVMLLGVVAWVAFLVYFHDAGNTGNYGLPFLILGVWNLLVLVAAVLTIVDSVRKVNSNVSGELAGSAMMTKLASFPFVMVNFVGLMGAFFSSFGLLLFGGPVLWVIVPIVGVLTYLVGLTTSVYGWAAITQMRRERKLSVALTVVFTILLLLPPADTVVGVLLFRRRRPRLALLAVMLTIGVLLIAGGSLLWSMTTWYAYGAEPVVLASIIVAVVGFALILAISIVSIVRRSALRTEAEEAALATVPSTLRIETSP
jgi:hypothetical protein